MLAANIQYKYILSGKHLTLVIHKLCLANCQLWQLSTKNCQVWQLSAPKLSGLTVVHLLEKLWQLLTWQLSDLTDVRADSCPSWQIISDRCLLIKKRVFCSQHAATLLEIFRRQNDDLVSKPYTSREPARATHHLLFNNYSKREVLIVDKG